MSIILLRPPCPHKRRSPTQDDETAEIALFLFIVCHVVPYPDGAKPIEPRATRNERDERTKPTKIQITHTMRYFTRAKHHPDTSNPPERETERERDREGERERESARETKRQHDANKRERKKEKDDKQTTQTTHPHPHGNGPTDAEVNRPT